jgi:PKD repeat protein
MGTANDTAYDDSDEGDYVNVTLSEDVEFTDNSSGADSVSWDFGDGETSTERNPTHTYYSNGDFTVIFTGTNQYGSSSTTKIVTITEVGTITGDTEEEGETEDSNIEPMPTNPPVGFNPITNPMTGTLSPQGQWRWDGQGKTWVAVEIEEEEDPFFNDGDTSESDADNEDNKNVETNKGLTDVETDDFDDGVGGY